MSAPNEPGAHNPGCQTRVLMLAAVIAAAIVLARTVWAAWRDGEGAGSPEHAAAITAAVAQLQAGAR
ncbi:MAG TPA: hypothetical protein VK586_16210 [Streptosporangiaceae bacterium]|nr:hypothetical protein [Streptosporangiaceae bacterium]